jgi:hypothetical protein
VSRQAIHRSGAPLPSRLLVSPDCASSHETAVRFPSPLCDRGNSSLNAIVTTIAATTSISNAIHRARTAVSLEMVIFWTRRRCRPDRPRGACGGFRRLGLITVLAESGQTRPGMAATASVSLRISHCAVSPDIGSRIPESISSTARITSTRRSPAASSTDQSNGPSDVVTHCCRAATFGRYLVVHERPISK